MIDQVRRVAVYERVSSDDQRERETIKTQTEMIDRYLSAHPEMEVYRRYRDDGVSGTIPLRERPEGGPLFTDARAGKFEAIVMTRPDRLGRNEIDRLQLFSLFQELQIELIGVCEPFGDEFMHGVNSLVDGLYLRRFKALSREGMTRAAGEGRYCGGIVPIGFKVEGLKQTARLVPSDIPIWADWTEADLVKQMYCWLAVDGWSCRKVADELNALGIPTAYRRDGRWVKERKGERKRRTQGVWRPSRIRNIVTNPVYKGELHYGRRSAKGREVIIAKIEGLVSEEIWNAAQETLARNRIIAKNTDRVYLLRSVIKCRLCGLTYSGYWDRGQVRYKCNGALVERGPIPKRCPNRSFYGRHLEEIVWADIAPWLRNPGEESLEGLAAEMVGSPVAAAAEADRLSLANVLDSFTGQRDRILDLYRRDLITPDDLEGQLAKIAAEQEEIEKRLATLTEAMEAEPEPISPDLLEEIRRKLPGLDDAARQVIVSLLVRRIVINTEDTEDGTCIVASVEYRFPRVVSSSTGRGSSPLPA